MRTENAVHAAVLKAFCDENRLTILQMLCSGEKCACRLQSALAIGQSTLSHHMKILCDAGIVQARKDGKWAYYSIRAEGRERALALVDAYTRVADHAAQDCCEP